MSLLRAVRRDRRAAGRAAAWGRGDVLLAGRHGWLVLCDPVMSRSRRCPINPSMRPVAGRPRPVSWSSWPVVLTPPSGCWARSVRVGLACATGSPATSGAVSARVVVHSAIVGRRVGVNWRPPDSACSRIILGGEPTDPVQLIASSRFSSSTRWTNRKYRSTDSPAAIRGDHQSTRSVGVPSLCLRGDRSVTLCTWPAVVVGESVVVMTLLRCLIELARMRCWTSIWQSRCHRAAARPTSRPAASPFRWRCPPHPPGAVVPGGVNGGSGGDGGGGSGVRPARLVARR